MAAKPRIKWRKETQPHDYPAAEAYLSLVFKGGRAKELARGLKRAPMVSFTARDILRASALSPLGLSDVDLKAERAKIARGVPLSPILLVRDKLERKVIIADGYHRVCAVYAHDQDAHVPCKIA